MCTKSWASLRTAHVWANTTVGTVCASAALLGSVHLQFLPENQKKNFMQQKLKGSEVIKEYERIWKDMKGYERIWKDMKGQERIWKDMKGYERIWKDMKGYERIWKDMKGYERIKVQNWFGIWDEILLLPAWMCSTNSFSASKFLNSALLSAFLPKCGRCC